MVQLVGCDRLVKFYDGVQHWLHTKDTKDSNPINWAECISSPLIYSDEEEDDAASFLGVRLERDPDTGMLEMKQTGLIDRCIEAMGLDNGQINSKWTPAEAKPLVKDEDGENARGDFIY